MASRSYIFLLLLGLCFFSVSAEVFESIDCGSTDIMYKDENSILWTGDANFNRNGLSKSVQITNNSLSHVMDTLRVFNGGRNKYCYKIKVDNKGERILVRASFYYGNYDGKSAPPSFDLSFDGNNWVTVHTYSDRAVYYEVIYVVKGDYTSICVAQINPDQFPFISALELRSLPPTMYSQVDANHALFLNRRIAYGTNATIRFTDDKYDRIWTPMAGGNGIISISSNTDIIVDDGDFPPKKVLQNAITTSTTSQILQLGTIGFPDFEVPVYLNMYFSELMQLNSTQKRSFTILKGNQTISSPILPPFGGFKELSGNLTASSNTSLFLVPTPDSTLPALINAVELFSISDALTDGTDSRDVDGLTSLQIAFDALNDWSGDPCLPSPYTWDWLNCSNDATPRVTALYLSSFGLFGSLPDFSSMDNLEIINLQNNSLIGPIPEFLGTFPNLKDLNLADNQFSGPIPASLASKNGLKLVVTGNPDLCSSGGSCETTRGPGSGSSSENPLGGHGPIAAGVGGKKSKGNNKQPIILGTTIPASLVILIACIFAILQYSKRRAVAASMALPNANANAGQSPGIGNTFPMPPLNPQMVRNGNGGQVAMNEIKVDRNEKIIDPTAQAAGNGRRRGY